MIKKLYFLVVVAVTFALVTPAAAAPLPQPAVDQATGLLSTHFGVTLALQAPYNGGTYNAFDWDSFVPTLNTGTVDFITEGDWYGTGVNPTPALPPFSMPQRRVRLTKTGIPQVGNGYDVEAMYFDNDANNIYVAIVTSVPFTITNRILGRLPGSMLPRWVLAITAGTRTAESHVTGCALAIWRSVCLMAQRGRNATVPGIITMRSIWCTRIAIPTRAIPWVGARWKCATPILGTPSMRRIMILAAAILPVYPVFDWYASTSGDGRVPAGWEHTNFDPASPDAGLANYLGDASYVDYYEYNLPRRRTGK